MSFMDKFLDIMRLNDDEEDEYEFTNDEYNDDNEEERKPLFRSRREKETETAASAPTRSSAASGQGQKGSESTPRRASSQREEYSRASKPSRPANKITPIRKTIGKQVSEEMEVCIIKPTSVADEQEIAETLMDGRAVVINMEGLDMDIAQRIMDFTAGSTFSIRGRLMKVSNFVFVATPQNVDVSGDIQNLVGSMGLSTDL